LEMILRLMPDDNYSLVTKGLQGPCCRLLHAFRANSPAKFAGWEFDCEPY
jgi:hypothetical protein